MQSERCNSMIRIVISDLIDLELTQVMKSIIRVSPIIVNAKTQ